MPFQNLSVCAAAVVAFAGSAVAQSDPSDFGTVYNIGFVPAGSIFDVPGAVNSTQTGDGNAIPEDSGFLPPWSTSGDVLG
ncbi:MAG: hypothetical protein AAGB34_10090 [Planctomycetota bacterium]